VKKNYIKIALDIIMTLLLLLMYSKNSVSMSFHEIGGLAVFGMFLIHKGLNWKWITSVSRRLTDKALPVRVRLRYIVDALLLITMTFIIVSGIMMSKVLFPGLSSGGMFWKSGHYFASAIAIILIGMHLGLHWAFIKSMLGRMTKLPKAALKPLSIICIIALLAYGGYSLTSTSFTRWLSMPFSVTSIQPREQPGKGEMQRPEGRPQDGSFKPDAALGQWDGNNRPSGTRGDTSPNLGRMLGVIASYGSITSIFAALTILAEKLSGIKRKI